MSSIYDNYNFEYGSDDNSDTLSDYRVPINTVGRGRGRGRGRGNSSSASSVSSESSTRTLPNNHHNGFDTGNSTPIASNVRGRGRGRGIGRGIVRNLNITNQISRNTPTSNKTTSNKTISKNSNKNYNDDMVPVMSGFKPIWKHISNPTINEYMIMMNNGNCCQDIVSKYSKLMQFIINCGTQFSGVFTDKTKVLISCVAPKETFFSWENHLFVIVQDRGRNLLYIFSREGDSPFKVIILDNTCKVLSKDNIDFNKKITHKLELHSNSTKIGMKFNTSEERNHWYSALQ
jgi:hypothetical protein